MNTTPGGKKIEERQFPYCGLCKTTGTCEIVKDGVYHNTRSSTVKTNKIEKCDICGKEYEVINEYSTCPDCYAFCSNPSYHNGPCDGSC